MKTLFKFALTLALVLAFANCSKQLSPINENMETVKLDEQTAQSEFAIILSKAVSQDKVLREFLKSESLKQFDMDYDILYQYVKGLIVKENYSFRDILLQYTTLEKIEEIEKCLPLLTIYVPNYSWIGAFCPEKWDTNDDEIVVAVKDGDDLNILYNGEIVGTIGEDQYADFPILVIKNNERLIVDAYDTKSGEITYQFISDAFDARLNNADTKAADWTYSYETIYDISEPTPYLSASELDPAVIAAYNEYGNTAGRYHRYYIYYGITNNNPSGVYNNYYKEYLYKIKISNPQNGVFYDSTTGTYVDGYFPDIYENKGEKNKYNVSELRALDFRIEGNLELRIYAVNGTKDGEVMTEEDMYNVSMNDLFDFNKVYIGEREKTWIIWRHKYTYSINKNCLVPKWYKLNKPLSLGTADTWNLGKTTPYIKIRVEEWDPGETVSLSQSFTMTFSVNATSETTSGNTKYGYGTTAGASHTVSYSYSYVNNSDVLGEDYLYFTDPVILSKSGTQYKMNVYSFGDLDMMIVPKHI